MAGNEQSKENSRERIEMAATGSTRGRRTPLHRVRLVRCRLPGRCVSDGWGAAVACSAGGLRELRIVCGRLPGEGDRDRNFASHPRVSLR